MKKIYILFLLLLSARSLSAAACKTDLSDIAKILPHPLWALILQYHGEKTKVSHRIDFESGPMWILTELQTNNEQSELYLRYYQGTWYEFCVHIPIPFKKPCIITQSKQRQIGSRGGSIQRLHDPLHVPVKKFFSSDYRFEAYVESVNLLTRQTRFVFSDRQGIDPNYEILYKLLVTDQKTSPASRCVIQ